MCALNIQIRDIYFGWLVVFVFFVSIVSEKSLADRRRAGRPINPFMTMIRFSLRLGGIFFYIYIFFFSHKPIYYSKIKYGDTAHPSRQLSDQL